MPKVKKRKKRAKKTVKQEKAPRTRKYLKVLVSAVIIITVAASGFEVPLTFPSPSVKAVDGAVTLFAEVRYAVFSGSCSYKQTVQETPLSMDEVIGISSKTYNGSTAVSQIEWLCKVIVSQVNYFNYYSSLSNQSVDVGILMFEAGFISSLNHELCSLAARYGGSCSPGEEGVAYVNIPLSLASDISYLVSARVAVYNQLPLTIERITANESDGRPLNVEFNETSCIEGCSFPVTLTSAGYSPSMVQSTSSIRLVLSLSTTLTVVWGFPFWWIRIGTTEKTITATLEVNLSNSTIRLLA